MTAEYLHQRDCYQPTTLPPQELDPDTQALIEWCTEVEGFLVAAGASLREAQGYIEEQAEWFTDQFYEGLTPQEAAKASLNEP